MRKTTNSAGVVGKSTTSMTSWPSCLTLGGFNSSSITHAEGVFSRRAKQRAVTPDAREKIGHLPLNLLPQRKLIRLEDREPASLPELTLR